jgi:hypothetical protein
MLVMLEALLSSLKSQHLEESELDGTGSPAVGELVCAVNPRLAMPLVCSKGMIRSKHPFPCRPGFNFKQCQKLLLHSKAIKIEKWRLLTIILCSVSRRKKF